MVATGAAAHRILVGEDDEAARGLLEKYLTGKGHDVVAVGDGQAVLDALAAAAAGFDLVLLDVMMPKLNGFAVLEALRARGDGTPVIMATAAATPDDVVKALSLGADDYVTKPFAFPVLMARIELRMRLRPIQAPAPPPTKAPPPEDTFDASDAVVDAAEPAAAGGIMARIRGIAARVKEAASRPPAHEPAEGTVIGERYVVGKKIGEGGFGQVFRARHVDLGHDVAVKVLRAHASSSQGVAGFRREAQNACRVRHPNAVRVYDFGLLGGSSAYLVMELLEGPTLEAFIKRTAKLDEAQALPILQAVLSALAFAHQEGLVHRDVKAQNVLLHEEHGAQVPKLLDFGIAKMLIDAGDTRNNVLMGSAAYIAPERLRGEAYDGRADVYACGVLLCRMLTGGFPFAARLDDFESIALWHLEGPPPHLGGSAGADALCAQLLEKDPRRRPTATEAVALVTSTLARH